MSVATTCPSACIPKPVHLAQYPLQPLVLLRRLAPRLALEDVHRQLETGILNGGGVDLFLNLGQTDNLLLERFVERTIGVTS